ncbi:hypothetical protein NP493_274g03029 [Ridgeia piscesae]|uniref:Phosphodiesterase n=1 Tax=Ridgeia piscesae TaxID=27915 RepID=A0AAD9NXG6_RIDPI|nr:hypothetical protein NP493_274g03029 [Ridgeia piscesae]
MEFTRGLQQTPFSEIELQTATCMLAWVSLATFEVKTNVMLKKQNDLNDFLLEVSKAFFDEVGMMSSLLEKIMQYTKDLVHADRISLFLVDKEKKELYIDIFDEGIQDARGKAMFKRSAEIRVPLTKGIAGFVARTGQIVNIPEAYKDPRFNRAVDKATGYTTKSILSMPIITHGQVIGVVQMINKLSPDGVFTSADEYAFKMFAVYCALSLRYAQLYNEIQLKTAQNKVVMEQLTYHSCSTDADAEELLRKWALVPKQVLEDLDEFDMKRLCRFVLTVKKNYRPMPYHNWTHGWSAAHSIYCILRRFQAREIPVFPFFWMRSMLIATICHDVDHRGRNNSFLQETKQPLSTLYKSSVMEQHHYATTIKILQQDGHNIFSNLSASDYRRNLRYIRHCILATDLVTLLPKCKEAWGTHQDRYAGLERRTSPNTVCHHNREVIVAMVMTAADLSSNYKHFTTQKKTVTDLFEEFYQQGDIEKSLGKTPIPLMDRNNKENLAKDEHHDCKTPHSQARGHCYTTVPLADHLHKAGDTNIATWEAVFAEKNKPPEEVSETPKSVTSSSSSTSSSMSLSNGQF